MGAWGFSILENDTALDIHSEYMDEFRTGASAAAIFRKLKKKNADILNDEDDAINFWVGLARAQWDCGHLDAPTIRRVEKLVHSSAGMALWEDSGPQSAAKRQAALQTFLKKLRSPNPKPRRVRKPIIRKSPFAPGNCLAIQQDDGKYAAAIVVETNDKPDKPGQDSYGSTHLVFLDYLKKKKPTMELFRSRKWLRTQHVLNDKVWIPDSNIVIRMHWKTNAHRFEIIGQSDPGKVTGLGRSYCGWDLPGFPYAYKAWQKAKRNPKIKISGH
jgi:hypothetical protein